MLTFHELGPSPNNLKVRMALRLKGIPFRAVPVDPADRSRLLEVSGQELSPVIEDEGRALNDSDAILQYLDANHRNAPRLYPPDRAGRKRCEAFTRDIDARAMDAWWPVFAYAIARAETLDEAARERYHDLLREWEDHLGGHERFSGTDDAVCDLWVAMFAVYGLPGEPLVERVRLFRRFREHFAVDAAAFPRLVRFLEPWNERLA